MKAKRWWRRAKTYTFDSVLESQYQDEVVVAHFDALWRQRSRWSAKVHNPEAVIREYVRSCANAVLEKESIARYRLIEDRLNVIFGSPRDIYSSGIRLVWVSVGFDDPDEEFLVAVRRREKAHVEALRREEEQRDEIRHIEAFRSQVLTDPGMALTYWFMKHPGGVEEGSYEEVKRLAQQIASYDPNSKWVLISKILERFIDRLTPSERRQSVEILRMWMTRHGMHDLVDSLPEEAAKG